MDDFKYSNTNSEEGLKSKYNSALAILFRIDILWKDAHRHSRSGQYDKWNMDLDRVWCELAADSTPEQLQNFDKHNMEIAKIGIKKVITPTGETKIKNKHQLYPKIMAKEIFLRVLQNNQGKGNVYEESIDEYMD